MWDFEPFWMLVLIAVFSKPVFKPGAKPIYIY